jgi:hypothetical protein
MNAMNFPVVFGVISAFALWGSARAGAAMHKRSGPTPEDAQEDLGIVVGAILTLLGLLIGFSFSMAISRYDQRKNYEEEEANAIGTEYVRADFLPAANAAAVRQLLSKYLDQRILSYTTRDRSQLATIDAETVRLQSEMWSEVKTAATAQPTPVAAVVVTGMNDVLNRQGYTQAAWWNRIPIAAWALMVLIALFSNFLIGFSAREFEGAMFWIVPLAVAISFMLIADIDSPRRGLIRVAPQNLISLAQSLRPQ